MKKVAIFGLGLMGGSLAAAIKKFVPDVEIFGYDREDILEKALERGYIDHKISEIISLPDDLNIAFLALPISDNISFLEKISKTRKWKDLLINDLGSTKESIMKIAENLHTEGVHFIGGHPMTGSEKSGIEAVNPYLYQNAVYILTGTEQETNHSKNFDFLLNILYKVGARVIEISHKLHDEIVAYISHLPHILAVSLMNIVDEKKQNDVFYSLCGGSFKDVTRVAGSSPALWKEIISQNREKIKDAIDSFSSYLQKIKDNLEPDEIEKIFQRASAKRKTLPVGTKGFLNPLVDIRVEVEDKPGMLADITTIISSHSISIKDIAILKIRENEGGVLQLSFENQEISDRVQNILKEKGYKIYS